MANNEVVLSVRSQLLKVIEELDKVNAKQQEVGESFKRIGKTTGDTLQDQTKRTQNFFNNLSGLGRRLSDQLKSDFKTLLSINAIGDSLKISNQFKGAIGETVALSDNIRKLGRVFGIAQTDFSKFQKDITKGLGDIGLSSEAASRAMSGLAGSGTPVSGQQSLIGYSRAAGQLASVTKSEGSEGEIAKLVAQVIQSRGGDVNDMKQVASVAEDVRRVFNATGSNAASTLQSMKQIFTGMSKDFREKITSRGLANLAAAATAGGPNATKFLEEFLSKSPIARKAMEAQGFKGVFNEKGIDVDKFQKASKSILSRVGGDPRLAAQTLGLSEDAAEGFVRLSEALDRVKQAQEGVNKATGDLDTQYRESMGLGESFKASINRVKKAIAGPLASTTQGLTDALSKASQSDLGAGAVVAGGGVLAAMLAGFGVRGVGRGMGAGLGGIATGAAVEGITGRQVQPVYVVNAAEIAGATSGGSMLGAGGKLGTAARVVGGIGAAYGVGAAASHLVEKTGGIGPSTPALAAMVEKATGSETLSDAVVSLGNLLARMNNSLFGTNFGMVSRQEVKVELNKRELKEAKQPTRGASH